MDIVKIGSARGEVEKFDDCVHPSQTKRCARYVEKCNGPSELLTNKAKKSALDFLSEAFKGFEEYIPKIGLVIDSSTTRGFTEPSQASLYNMHLGIRHAAAFDMVEACNGFCRAAETAYYYLNCREELEGKYVLLINNEYPPETRALVPKDDSDYRLNASYYVGMTFSFACTVTLLEKSNNRSWQFYNNSDTLYASHINIPMPVIAKDYLPKCEEYQVVLNEQYGQFCLPKYHMMEEKGLLVLGYVEKCADFFKKANVICHTYSKKVWEELFKYSDFRKLSLYFNETGNIGSCSFPFALHDQYGPTLPEGEHLAFMGTAAGGSGSIVTFIHKHDSGERDTAKLQQTAKPIGKKMLMLKMGLRVLFAKILCQKKNKSYSPAAKKRDADKKKKNI